MTITLKRTDDKLAMQADNGRGHSINLDASEQAGGSNSGVSPMETALMAAAGCSSIDILDILGKQRLQVDDLHVEAEGERAENPPKVFTSIVMHYYITGELPEAKVRRAVELSLNQYCSVSKMLEKTADISYTLTLNGERVE